MARNGGRCPGRRSPGRRSPGRRVTAAPPAPYQRQERAESGGTVSEAEGYPGVGRVLVVIPTYNEADNVRLITSRVRRAVPSVDILVADDNSPDGTGDLADEIAAADDHVFVLHRAGKEGLGAAYV